MSKTNPDLSTLAHPRFLEIRVNFSGLLPTPKDNLIIPKFRSSYTELLHLIILAGSPAAPSPRGQHNRCTLAKILRGHAFDRTINGGCVSSRQPSGQSITLSVFPKASPIDLFNSSRLIFCPIWWDIVSPDGKVDRPISKAKLMLKGKKLSPLSAGPENSPSFLYPTLNNYERFAFRSRNPKRFLLCHLPRQNFNIAEPGCTEEFLLHSLLHFFPPEFV